MNSRTHGILDYIVSALVAASPWLFGFADEGAETWVPYLVGVTGFLYSAATNYEFGMVRIIPMKTHLALDIASGVFLAASPWLFGFADRIFAPHVIFGLFEIGAATMTRRAVASRVAGI